MGNRGLGCEGAGQRLHIFRTAGAKSHAGWGLGQPGAGAGARAGADAGAGLYFSNNSLGRGLVEEALRERIR